jgi:hypothetical protein
MRKDELPGLGSEDRRCMKSVIIELDETDGGRSTECVKGDLTARKFTSRNHASEHSRFTHAPKDLIMKRAVKNSLLRWRWLTSECIIFSWGLLQKMQPLLVVGGC